MFFSRFCKLGVHAIGNLEKSATLTVRTSYAPKAHNQYLGSVRNKFFCSTAPQDKETINVIFCDKDGEETHIKVPVGMSMLEAAHENDIELEGACEGSLACSTCHVIVMDVDQYNKLSEPTDEENDMLDLAFGLSETSRLGCQIIAKPELDGLRLAIPAATRNFAVDGFKPKPH
ncbi:adrenodoxin-like protein 2, mitochondrial [Salvia hispanica]|uniref:adrenodoxin-like protein 2, mitochondrial n=1 Tax=Salvia hispanica TaxID=49212 RepID=UPI002008F61C|nr:adrenodoxin-like protein 2, mitochondrial [Salvia hispanica]XP_047979948.1 adrenodoxin-like protein 2, mitochondrial [Salvia hispanica]